MTRGRVRGAVLLAGLSSTQEEIARRCGVRQAAVSYWTTGFRRPRDEHRIILRDAFGIPIDAWIQPAAEYNSLLS